MEFFKGININTAVWCRSSEEAFYFFQIVSHYGLKWQNDTPFQIDDYKRWNNVMCCYALRGSMGGTREYDLLMTYNDFYKRIKPMLDAEGFELIPFAKEQPFDEEEEEKPETNLEHFAANLAGIIASEVSKETLIEYDFPLEIASEGNGKKILEWLVAEYKEPVVELSAKEKGFIYYCGVTGFIARDKTNLLYWFDTRPQFESGYWDVREPSDGYNFKAIEAELFSFIKCEDMMSVRDIFQRYMKGEQI